MLSIFSLSLSLAFSLPRSLSVYLGSFCLAHPPTFSHFFSHFRSHSIYLRLPGASPLLSLSPLLSVCLLFFFTSSAFPSRSLSPRLSLCFSLSLGLLLKSTEHRVLYFIALNAI